MLVDGTSRYHHQGSQRAKFSVIMVRAFNEGVLREKASASYECQLIGDRIEVANFRNWADCRRNAKRMAYD